METVTIIAETFEHNGIVYKNSLTGLKKFIRKVILPPAIGVGEPMYDHLVLNGIDIKLCYAKLIKGLGYWKARKPGILKEINSYLHPDITIQSIEIISAEYVHRPLGNGNEYLETVKESEVRIQFK